MKLRAMLGAFVVCAAGGYNDRMANELTKAEASRLRKIAERARKAGKEAHDCGVDPEAARDEWGYAAFEAAAALDRLINQYGRNDEP
jgi:hypothetical protein